jgi:hypothetical protein
MKKDLVKLAIVGLLAGFCLSAQGAPSDAGEIAMSKCTKDDMKKSQNRNNGMLDDDEEGDNSDVNGCNGPSGCGDNSGQNNGDQQSSKVQMMQSKRKSAAQKVVEGEGG